MKKVNLLGFFGACVLAGGALLLVASLGGCKRVCNKVQSQVFGPTHELVVALQALAPAANTPDGPAVKATCLWAVSAISEIETKAARLRNFLNRRLTERTHVCRDWQNEHRLVCRDIAFPYHERRGANEMCGWSSEPYCADWDRVKDRLPQYPLVNAAWSTSQVLHARIVQECSVSEPRVSELLDLAQRLSLEVDAPYQNAYAEVCAR